MNEEPKSIWKKSFTGRVALVIWLAVTFFTIMLGSFITALLNYNRPMSDWLTAVGILAGGILAACLILIYVVWPLLRWFFLKYWRRGLFALACLATLIALAYAEEDWRGWHAWNKFKHEWEAKGEHFDLASVVPPPVPDDQNFAMAPIWVESIKATLGPERARRWYGDKFPDDGRTNFTERLYIPLERNGQNNTPAIGLWAAGTITDLKSWQAYYRAPAQTNRDSRVSTNEFPISTQPQTPAQDVLLALSKYDSTLEELRHAAQLPYSRFPLEYNHDDPAAILLPHLAALRRCSLTLGLRAAAELQNGQGDKAFDDVKFSLRLTDSVRTEPFLISHLVRIVMLQSTLQPIYEGLAAHQWSDAQLIALDSELANMNFLTDYRLTMRSEAVFTAKMIDYIQHRGKISEFLDMNNDGKFHNRSALDFAVYMFPSGWFRQNQFHFAEFYFQQCLPLADVEHGIVSPKSANQANAYLEAQINHPNPCNLFENIFLSPFKRWFSDDYVVVKKFAYAQESADMARAAIALERYRLAHGEYPESLDALAPQFLEKIPQDVINGNPLHYRRTSDGQFVLYSVGWNEKDDGGVAGLTKGGDVDINKGDWVWRYPQK